jgi:tetratricopeptide (TPR) repeat protein
MPTAVGARFGRYELTGVIGAGGMGEVYRARDHDLHRDVAVKVLPSRYAADASRLARFTQEARAASSLNHPNIVTIHEVGEAFGQPFIVMELIDGTTLRGELERGPVPGKRALEYAAQIAEGLAKAHAAGIVHRDLKPENVMVTRDGFVKILDFGLAKLRADRDRDGVLGISAPGDTQSTRAAPATDAGTILGTVGYMSPEQAAGQAAVYQSDQFSLGVILYEMATGKRAFERSTTVQTLSAIIEDEPQPLQDLNPAFPAPARWIVERCLAKEPAGRYASTIDLAHELRGVREHVAEATSGSAGHAAERGGPRRRLRVWAAAVTVLAALLGLVSVPRVNDAIRAGFGWLPLPGDKRVAILPAECRGGTEDERQACEGLLEFVAIRLGEVPRFQPDIEIVPATDVRQNGVSTAASARGRLGATLAVQLTAARQGDAILLAASLIDTTRLRQLRAPPSIRTAEASLLDDAVRAVVSMLELEVGAEARAALRAGGSSIPGVATLFAQGQRNQPLQTAQTALERYDQQQSIEQAIDAFTRALELDPRFALAHAGLGEAHLRLYRLTRRPEQLDLAEQHCRRALALDPLVPQVWQTLGNLHTETGKADEALEDFARAIARNPRSAEVYRDLANTYAKLNRHKDAEATFQKALGLRSPSWSIHSYYGSFLYRQNRFAEALAAFKQGLRLAPENARLWSSLGVTYYKLGQLSEADAAFTRSLSIFPTGVAASNAGTLRFNQGQYAAAVVALEKATSLSPRDYRLWRNLGAAYYWAPGERERAAGAYRTALGLGEQGRQINPGDGQLVVELADCAAMLGDRSKALALVQDALRLAPDDSEVQYKAADVYETLGSRNAALRWLGSALRAGYPLAEVERSPSMARLRADPFYENLKSGLPSSAGGR